MAVKTPDEIVLRESEGIKNIFVNKWKKHFFSDNRERIASIPFMRNLIEYTLGVDEPDYDILTSLLHWKSGSLTITNKQLDDIYNKLFPKSQGAHADPTGIVLDMLQSEANACLKDADGVNFENKIVLSIAIRLSAERFMVNKIADDPFWQKIQNKQTDVLLNRFKVAFRTESATIRTLMDVLLMTPENIHLNAFMYEPILDMSDDHLRKLYMAVQSLK
jgi:hypothetical protein